ncbi:MAG: lipopolysaccharide biosynthesis protein [Actinomycetota bacterium]
MTRPADSEQLSFWRTRRWWLLAGQASAGVYVATALSLVATLVVARALGPGGFGSLELAVVTVAGVSTLLDFSLEEAVIHHGARALAEGDRSGLRGLIRTSLRIDVAIGLAVFAILAATAPLAADIVSEGELATSLIRLAALEALVVTVNGTTGALLVVCGRPHLRAWSSAVANAARLGGVAIAAAADAGALGMLVGLVVGSAIGSIAQAALAWRTGRSTWHGTGSESKVAAAKILRFGAHSSLTTTLVAVRSVAVFVLLGRTLGPAAVGVFAVAMFPVTLSEVASSPIRLMMIPEHATLAARGRPDVVWNGVVAYAKGSLVVGIAAAAVGWLVLPSLLPLLYGSSYEAAVRPARILLVAAVAGLVVAWSKALPAALGRAGVRTAMSFAELALTLAALVAVSDRGVSGIAVAISTVSVVMACAWWMVARRMLAPVSGTAASR